MRAANNTPVGTINGDSKDIDPSLRFHYYRACLSVGDKVRWTNERKHFTGNLLHTRRDDDETPKREWGIKVDRLFII